MLNDQGSNVPTPSDDFDGNLGADSSSLVHNRISVGACPAKEGFVFVSEATGAVAPASCQRNGCKVCGWRKAMATAMAVDRADPERFFSLTGIEDPKVVRHRLRQVRYRLRGMGYRWEDWSVVEMNPGLTGYHLHGWQWGDFVPQKTLASVAESEGFGMVTDIRRWKRIGAGSGAMYGVKAATAYGVKGCEDVDALGQFLDLNGGRIGMWSQGFFRGPYLAAVRSALVQEDREGHDPGPWHLKGTAGGIYA